MWPAVCAMIQTSLQIDETEITVGLVHTLCHSLNCPGLCRAEDHWSFISEQTGPSTSITPSSPHPTAILPYFHCPGSKMNSGGALLLWEVWLSRWGGRLNWEVCLPESWAFSIDSVTTNQRFLHRWPPQSYITAPVHYLTTVLHSSAAVHHHSGILLYSCVSSNYITTSLPPTTTTTTTFIFTLSLLPTLSPWTSSVGGVPSLSFRLCRWADPPFPPWPGKGQDSVVGRKCHYVLWEQQN